MSDIDTSTSEIVIGRVKWFNSKSGYGFVTVVDNDSEFVGKDVFVHHTAISVKDEQYKYLVQGEYVNLSVVTTDDDKHPHQATNVTGVGGGMTMCETRNEIRKERGDSNGDDESGGQRSRHVSSRGRGRGGRDSSVKGIVRQELWNLLNDNGRGDDSRRHGRDFE